MCLRIFDAVVSDATTCGIRDKPTSYPICQASEKPWSASCSDVAEKVQRFFNENLIYFQVGVGILVMGGFHLMGRALQPHAPTPLVTPQGSPGSPGTLGPFPSGMATSFPSFGSSSGGAGSAVLVVAEAARTVLSPQTSPGTSAAAATMIVRGHVHQPDVLQNVDSKEVIEELESEDALDEQQGLVKGQSTTTIEVESTDEMKDGSVREIKEDLVDEDPDAARTMSSFELEASASVASVASLSQQYETALIDLSQQERRARGSAEATSTRERLAAFLGQNAVADRFANPFLAYSVVYHTALQFIEELNQIDQRTAVTETPFTERYNRILENILTVRNHADNAFILNILIDLETNVRATLARFEQSNSFSDDDRLLNDRLNIFAAFIEIARTNEEWATTIHGPLKTIYEELSQINIDMDHENGEDSL